MNNLFATLISLTASLISLVIYVVLCFALYKFSGKLIKTKPVAGLAVSMLGIFLFPVGIAIPIINFVRVSKESARVAQEKYAIMSDLARDPDDEKVTSFMKLVDSEGGIITNQPQAWNSFRSLWFAVNENPNVSTPVKRDFLMWLSSKGLILSAKQSQIIDNCKK